jgi:hypothetical protein
MVIPNPDRDIVRVTFNIVNSGEYIILVKARSGSHADVVGKIDGGTPYIHPLSQDYLFIRLITSYLSVGSHTLLLSDGGNIMDVLIDKLVIYPSNFDRLITDPTDPDTDSDGALDGEELPLGIKWYDLGEYPLGGQIDLEAGGGVAIKSFGGNLYVALQDKVPVGAYNIMFYIKGGSPTEYRIDIHHDGTTDHAVWKGYTDRYSWVSATGIQFNSAQNLIEVYTPSPAQTEGFIDAIVIVPAGYTHPFSNPQDTDTDSDGYSDGREFFDGSDPKVDGGKNIALLVVGGQDRDKNSALFWNDMVFGYETLIMKGYTQEGIIFLYADGNVISDENSRGVSQAHIPDWNMPVEGSGTKSAFYDTMILLATRTISRFLLILEDHGGDLDEHNYWLFRNGQPYERDPIHGYFYLWDDDVNDERYPALSDWEVRDALNMISVSELKIVIVEACMSGRFINDISGLGNIVITTTNSESFSGGADGCIWDHHLCFDTYPPEDRDPSEDSYSEFMFHFYQALRNSNVRWDPDTLVDDDRISVAEAFNYAAYENSLSSPNSGSGIFAVPQYDDDGDGISHQTRAYNGRVTPLLICNGDGQLGKVIFI